MKKIYSLCCFVVVSYLATAQCKVGDFKFLNNLGDDSYIGQTGFSNNVVYTTDRFGNQNSALLFDTNNTSSTHITSSERNIEKSVSISLWIYSQSSVFQSITDWYNSSQDRGFHLIMENDSIIFAGRNGSGQYQLSGWAYLPQNEWHHVVGVSDEGLWQIYIDGQLVAENDYSSQITAGLLAPDNMNWTLGRTSYATNVIQLRTAARHNAFHGRMDDMLIYNCPLNAEEIQNIYEMDQSYCLVGEYLFEADGYTNDNSPEQIDGKAFCEAVIIGSNPNETAEICRELPSRAIDRFGEENKAIELSRDEIQPGHPGYGLLLDGELKTVGRGIREELTVSVWVKSSNDSTQMRIIQKYDGLNGYLLNINKGKPSFSGRSGSGGYESTPEIDINVTDGKWHQLVGSYITGVWSLFVDGIEVAKSDQYNVQSPDLTPDNTALIVGFAPDNGTIDYHGLIDDLTIYRCAKSSQEILQKYNDEKMITATIQDKIDYTTTVYPNPTTGIVNVKSDDASILVNVYSLDGTIQLSTTNKSFDLSFLAAGMYLIEVIGSEGLSKVDQLQVK